MIGGVPTEVSVDDYIPVKYANNKEFKMQIAFAKNVLWLMLAEKAWAKLYGSYERIESGAGIDTLKDLVGCEGINVKIKEAKDKTWDKVD